MNYSFTGLNPIYDGQRNITGWLIQFTGRNDQTGEYLNGSVKVSTADFSATGFQAEAINALIGPAVQAMVGPETTTTTTTA